MTLFGNQPPGADYSRDPYPFLARLREEAPLHYLAERNAWFVSDYQDIVELLRDDRLDITSASSFSDQSPAFRASVVRSLRAYFAPPHPSELTSVVERIVGSQVQHIQAQGEADLVADLAQAVPFLVIAELLGIPNADRQTLRGLTGPVLRGYDLTWDGRPPVFTPAKPLLDAYFKDHLGRARRDTGTPIMEMLLSEQHEHHLSDESLIDACTKFLTGGSTTTAGCIANAIARLTRPDHAAAFSAGVTRAGLAHATAECLRLDTPVLAIKRVANTDFTLGGLSCLAGQRVHLLVASANRDPALFPIPDEINWRENSKSHLSFGKGRHHCLGSPLARLELHTVLAHLLPLLTKLNLSKDIAWHESWFIHEPREIVISIKED